VVCRKLDHFLLDIIRNLDLVFLYFMSFLIPVQANVQDQ
jgi:hypothetical protein